MECNKYDATIQDFRYYANDKRRSKDYRALAAKAATELELANLELKECRKVLRNLICAYENVLRAAKEAETFLEEES